MMICVNLDSLQAKYLGINNSSAFLASCVDRGTTTEEKHILEKHLILVRGHSVATNNVSFHPGKVDVQHY